MYQKYHTEAVVLGGRDTAEADRTLFLFTRDFGLVSGRASAIRKERSKMRYALQNYSRAEVSLVRGKNGWRLAGATPLKTTRDTDRNGIKAFARISELALRLVAGEEGNPHLFEILAEAHSALLRKNCGAWATIELVCVARILHSLGYISTEALDTALFTHTAYAEEHLKEAETMREKLLSSVNQAISQTQM